MPEGEREAWLTSFRARNPALASLVQSLLDEHQVLREEGFLEHSPTRLSVRPEFAGQTMGPYKLVSPIGEGGMGSVWLAERSDGKFQRRVAVKFLRGSVAGRAGEERFKREGMILARLAHPHIAQLLDAGVSSALQPYLVIEYVEGEDIVQYCDEHKLSVDARVRLFLDVLAALAHAHSNLVVHRDIKPSNVWVGTNGQVKLLDFGIAKLLGGEGGNPGPLLTREGTGALTPEYAAPEQVTGQPVTTATDVYSSGTLLYELLTGQHPAGSAAHTPAGLVKAIVEMDAPGMGEVIAVNGKEARAIAVTRATTPDKLRRALRGDLETVVAKALKKDPQERYASATAMSDDLRRYLGNKPVSARSDTVAYRARKFVRRNRTAVALAALAFMASVAGVTSTLIQSRTARAERDRAVHELLRSEAINELDDFLLTDAAPSGKPFTVDELLRRAEHVVEHQRDADVANRVELLTSIGRKYWGQDEQASARRVLAEAYRLSREVREPAVRAKASCALASSLAEHGEVGRAEALFQSGLRELPREPQFALARSDCLLRGSEVARGRGDAAESIARAEAARDVLQRSPFDSAPIELHIAIEIAESYRQAGQYRKAITGFKQASALLTSLGRNDTQTAGTLLNNWALALDEMGRPRDAVSFYRRAIDISRADESEEAVSPMLLLNYARVLRELRQLDQAADYAGRASAKALQAGDEVVINQSLLERSRIYREQNLLPRAAAMLEQVEPRLRRDLPPGHYAFGALALERGLLAQARGNSRAALVFINQAMAILDGSVEAGGQGISYIPIVLSRRSEVELEMGEPSAAETDAARALKMLQQTASPGTFSCNLGRADLALGRALEALGRHKQARQSFRSAAENLEDSVGPNHPETRAARELATLNSPN